MKKSYISLLFLFNITFCFGQINKTLSSIDNITVKAKFDLSKFQESKFIFKDFNGKEFTIIKKSLNTSNGDIQYVGEVQGVSTNFIFVKKGENCFGKIQTFNKIYEIKSLDALTFEIKEHSAFLPENECDLKTHITKENIEENILQNYQPSLVDAKIGYGTTIPEECNLRLLIALTDQVSSDPLIDVTMIASVIELNQVFINSGLNHKVDLVGIIHNVPDSGFENESNSSIAIENLMDGNDGIADFLVEEKEKYSADILALVQSNQFSGALGRAGGIGTDSEHSYCIGVRDAVVFYYTLTHEIGHLLGASHHNVSSSSVTYGTARGFFKEITHNDDDFYVGSIMTTGLLDASTYTTTRQPYFSNLVNNHPAFGVFGAADRNSASVLDFTLNQHVKGLRTIPNDITVENVLGYSSYYAKNNITTGTLYNSNQGFLVAENAVTLNPHSKITNNFLIKITEVSSCGTGEVPGAIYFDKTEDYLMQNHIVIYPNPVSEYLTFKTIEFKAGDIKIYNFNSKIIYSESNVISSNISTKDMAKGVYYLKFENGKVSQTLKFIKK